MFLRVYTCARCTLFIAGIVSTLSIGSQAQVRRCEARFKAGGSWLEAVTMYPRSKHEMPNMGGNPMLSATSEKDCDMSFQRASDSVRFRISFCHVRVEGAVDSGKTRKIGAHIMNVREIKTGGRVVLDLSVRSAGCETPWGLIIRKDEMPAFKSLLRELRFVKQPD